jgi:hypothetical protein
MADLSYLFGGDIPSSLTSSLSDSSSQLPAWLQEYTRSLSGKAVALAGTPYQFYTAPTNVQNYGVGTRIAPLTPLQQQAYQMVSQNVGNYKPFLDYAANTIPQIQNNYMDNAARSIANTTLPSQMSSYMNPYISQVVNRIAQLGQRNLTENLLPQVNQTFTGAGQFGGTRNAEFTNRALRDANESILGQQAQALYQGFAQQQQAALQDLQRRQQGLLDTTRVAQQAAYNDLLRQAQLAQSYQQLGAQDVSLLETAGLQQQAQQQRAMDLAYKDFLAQRDYDKSQLSFLSEIIRGQQVPGTNFTTRAEAPTYIPVMSPLAAATQGFLGASALASQTQQRQT